MTARGATRTAVGAAVALALAAGISGCGKRGALEAPPGMEGQYKYPRQYPRPPKSDAAAPAAEKGAAVENGKEKQDGK